MERKQKKQGAAGQLVTRKEFEELKAIVNKHTKEFLDQYIEVLEVKTKILELEDDVCAGFSKDRRSRREKEKNDPLSLEAVAASMKRCEERIREFREVLGVGVVSKTKKAPCVVHLVKKTGQTAETSR